MQIVFDPALLHDREFREDLVVKPRQDRYLPLYRVMEQATDTMSKAVEYAKSHDLTIVVLSDHPPPYRKVSDPGVRHTPRHDVSAEGWLGYTAHSDAVFTSSFHGCSFSITFETF